MGKLSKHAGSNLRKQEDEDENSVGVSHEINGDKLTERALYESENKYRMLIEQASDGIHTYDMQGNFIEINSKLCEMLGYPPEELLRLNVQDLVPAEDLAANPIRFEELSAGKTLLKERRLIRKDGTLIPVEISGRMIRDGVLQGIVRDISERKRAEESLRNNANQLRLITDAIPLLISFVDKDHYYRFVNRTYTEWFRQPKENVVGRHLSEVLGQTAYRELLPELERVLSGEEVVFERFVSYASGKRFIHAQYIPEINDSSGQVIGFHAFVQDISERKRAEETLRSSEELLQGTIDALTSNIAVLNSEGVIIKVNAAWREFADQNLLRDANYSIGSNYIEKCQPAVKNNSRRSDSLALDVINAISGVMKGNREFFELEYPCHSPTETRWFVMRVTCFGEEENRCIVVAHENITTRKTALIELEQAQRQLRRSHEELEQKVQERTSELKKANESLQREITERRQAEEERVKVLHQLVTAQEDERRRIARDLHDQLGQQLTALRLKLEVLKRMCGGNGELSASVGETQKVARQLDLDVDFLAWQMRPTVLDDLGIVAALGDYVRQWSAHFNILAEFNANRFGKTHLSAEAETQLYRIAQEALNNICKHAQAASVIIMLEPRGNFAVLIIEDDGIGFKPDKQIANRKGSKGLGLIGIHERAALIGGAVEVESAKGKGTTIYVKVPISGKGEGK